MNDLTNVDLLEALPELAEDIRRLHSLIQELVETDPDRLGELSAELRRRTQAAEESWAQLHGIELDRRPGQSFLALMQRDFPAARQGQVSDVCHTTSQAVAHSPGLADAEGQEIETPYAYVSGLFSIIQSLADWVAEQNDALVAELHSEE